MLWPQADSHHSLCHGARAGPTLESRPCSRPTCRESAPSAQHMLCCGARPTHTSSLCHGALAGLTWASHAPGRLAGSLRQVPGMCCAVVPGRLMLAVFPMEHEPVPCAWGRPCSMSEVPGVCTSAIQETLCRKPKYPVHMWLQLSQVAA